MRIEDERDRVARQGTEAWRRLKRDKNWGDWIKVGEALEVGREWAMNQAGTNKPEGKGYNTALGEWLSKYKLDDIDKGDRSRLFTVMDNLGMIEEWRRTLTLTERLRLNHPNAVLRKWKAAVEPEKEKDPNATPTLRDSVVTLSEESAAKDQRIAELEARLQEAEAAREQEPQPAHSSIDAWVAALENKSLEERADALYELMLRLDLSLGYLDEAHEKFKARARQTLWQQFTLPEKQIEAEKPRGRKSSRKRAKLAGNNALVWKDTGNADGEHHSYEAPAAVGLYKILPSEVWGTNKFGGYQVTHCKPNQQKRVINTARTAQKAKAIAQRDHDAGNDAR